MIPSSRRARRTAESLTWHNPASLRISTSFIHHVSNPRRIVAAGCAFSTSESFWGPPGRGLGSKQSLATRSFHSTSSFPLSSASSGSFALFLSPSLCSVTFVSACRQISLAVDRGIPRSASICRKLKGRPGIVRTDARRRGVISGPKKISILEYHLLEAYIHLFVKPLLDDMRNRESTGCLKKATHGEAESLGHHRQPRPAAH